MAHYTCGSRVFIERLRDELFTCGIGRRILSQRNRSTRSEDDYAATLDEHRSLRKRFGDGPYPLTVYRRKGANAFDLRITTNDMLLRLYRYFYDGVGPAMYLERKFAMIQSHLCSSVKDLR